MIAKINVHTKLKNSMRRAGPELPSRTDEPEQERRGSTVRTPAFCLRWSRFQRQVRSRLSYVTSALPFERSTDVGTGTD